MASVAIESHGSELQPEKTKDVDEITKYVNCRFLTGSEGNWRIMGFDVHGREPSIQQLAVHEENLQMVTFSENSPDEPITNPKDTTLLAWFKLNQIDTNARNFKYHEIPKHYVWNKNQCKWTQRKKGRCIGCVYISNPAQGECYYLRLLLHHIPGAKSYTDLKTSNGVVNTTFKETALALGLPETDEEWDECLSEAALSFMPKQLHSLFVTILIFGEPAKPTVLWEKFKEIMGKM